MQKSEDSIGKKKNGKLNQIKAIEIKRIPAAKLMQHPVNKNLSIPMSEQEYQSVKTWLEKGYDATMPIEVDAEFKVIDGWHRREVCCELNVMPWVRILDLTSDKEKADFVVRSSSGRQLTKTQQACLAAKRILFDPDDEIRNAAEKRRKAGKKVEPSASGREDEEKGKTAKKWGQKVGVSTRSIERAKKVYNHGIPELITIIEGKDEVSLSDAAACAGLEIEEQEELTQAYQAKKGQSGKVKPREIFKALLEKYKETVTETPEKEPEPEEGAANESPKPVFKPIIRRPTSSGNNDAVSQSEKEDQKLEPEPAVVENGLDFEAFLDDREEDLLITQGAIQTEEFPDDAIELTITPPVDGSSESRYEQENIAGLLKVKKDSGEVTWVVITETLE
ncbi:hypothetical protein ACFL35_12725 [Candidatus Riflebacteria bacterium]